MFCHEGGIYMRHKKTIYPFIRVMLVLFLSVLLVFDGISAQAIAEAMDGAQDLAAQDEDVQVGTQNTVPDERDSSAPSRQTPTPELIARAAEVIRAKSNGQGEEAFPEATARLFCVSVAAAQLKAAQRSEGDAPSNALEEAFFLVNDSKGAATLVESLSKELGLDCVTVQSEDAQATWNLIKVSDAWYHVDVWKRARDLVAVAEEPGKQEESREWLLMGELELVAKDQGRSGYKVLSERDESLEPIVVSEEDYLWDAGTTQNPKDESENANASDAAEPTREEADGAQEQAAQEESAQQEQAAQQEQTPEQNAQETTSEGQKDSEAADAGEAQADGASGEQTPSLTQEGVEALIKNVQLTPENNYEAYVPIGSAVSSDTKNASSLRLHVWVSFSRYGSELWRDAHYGDTVYVNYNFVNSFGNEVSPANSGYTARMYLSNSLGYNISWNVFNSKSKGCMSQTYTIDESTGATSTPVGIQEASVQLTGAYTGQCNISWKLIDSPIGYYGPYDQSVMNGTYATFSVYTYSGSNLRYQWYYIVPNGGSYYINGATSSTYSVLATSANSGYKYYCHISNYGNSITTDSASLYTNYRLTYDANGGTGAPEGQIKGDGEWIRIRTASPTRAGYTFLGWSTNKNATTPEYRADDWWFENKDMKLYAVWRQNAKSISGCGVSLSATSSVYTGAAIKPTVKVQDGNRVLRLGTDYNVTYSNNVNAGTAKVTVTGINGYRDAKSVSFKITPASIAKAGVAAIANQQYTAAGITPRPAVKYGNRTLRLNYDYTLRYENNVRLGTGVVVITGKGNYNGVAKKKFSIVRRNLKSASVSAIANQAYTGKAISPKPTVKAAGRTLKLNRDYTLKYANNTKIGTATITIVGKGGYNGSKKVTFKITKRPISKAAVKGCKASYNFTGRAIKPGVTVWYGKTKLRNGKDYKVAYKNNVKAGTASIVITGKGIYGGSKTIKFKIVKKSISKAAVKGCKASYAYTGRAIKPGVTVWYGKTKLRNGKDYAVAYKNNVNAGTASIVITGKGIYGGTKTVKFKITNKPISKATVTGYRASYGYTGGAIRPGVAVSYGKAKLRNGKDYKVAYKNNVNAGTASIVVTGVGAYGGTKTVTFKITKQSIAKAAVGNIGDQAYTGSAVRPSPAVRLGNVTLRNNVDYKLSYKSNINIGTATVVVTGSGNYEGVVNKTFRIVDGQPYKMRRDTWNFENPALAVPYSYCTDLYPSSQARYLYNNQELYEAGGQCYGMATSAGAIKKYGSPSASSFRYGGSSSNSLYGVGRPWTATKSIRGQARTITAEQYIQYCFISQFDQTNLKEMYSNANRVDGLISATKQSVTGGMPIVIDFFEAYAGRMYYGHTVMPLSIKESANQVDISIYDSNYPREEQTLSFYKENGAWRYMSYTGYSAYNWFSWETPGDNLNRLFAGNGNYNYSSGTYGLYSLNNLKGASDDEYTLYLANSNMKVTIDGKEYDLSKETELDYNVIMKASRTNGMGGNGEEQSLYWIKSNVGEVTFKGIDEDATVAAASNTGGIEANVSAGAEVSLNVSDSSDNKVTISQDNGRDFKIRYFEDNGKKDVDEVVVSGTSAGDVNSTQYDDIIEVSGAQSLGATDKGDAKEEKVSPTATYTVDATSGELQK